MCHVTQKCTSGSAGRAARRATPAPLPAPPAPPPAPRPPPPWRARRAPVVVGAPLATRGARVLAAAAAVAGASRLA